MPASHSPKRRLIAAGLVAWPAAPAFAQAEPEVEAFNKFLGGRRAQTGRLVLDIPRIADNGNVVPLHIVMPGPFPPGAEVKTIHLFSEKNPVPQMAVFHFPQPVAKVEIESRIRLAGSQRLAAVATLADGSLYYATADVTVTVSACIDGT
jgi:sulfur-oxidizing protein SoxY